MYRYKKNKDDNRRLRQERNLARNELQKVIRDNDEHLKRTMEELQRKTAEMEDLLILYRDGKDIIEGLKSDCRVYKETIQLLERQFKDMESRYFQLIQFQG